MAKKIKGSFCEAPKAAKAMFDPRSFRWKKSGKAWVLVGCPWGKWATKAQAKGRPRCLVGMRAYKVLKPSKGKCPRGQVKVSKR